MSTDKIPNDSKSAKAETLPPNDLIVRVKAMLAKGMSQEAVAQESGVSATALSLWLSGKYPSGTEKLEAKIERWMEQRVEAEALRNVLPEDPPFYATPTALKILPILQYSQLSGTMGLIYGGAGVCKSSTAAHYQAQTPNVWSATASPATKRVSSFLELVTDEMALTVSSRTPVMLERAIVRKLKSSRGLLVIDEAQYLEVETLYELTMLRERGKVGVVVMGNEAIYGKAKSGFAQLYSRFGKRLRLTSAQPGDLEVCLATWERHIGLRAGTLKSADIQNFFWGRKDKPGPAQQDGGLRNVTETLRLAIFLANGEGETVTLKHIQAAWRDIAVQ